ncbi:MAG: IS110 family transposase [Hyphomicrobiales bacterium]|jgi:transposase|nr:IS110 family transposase [Hyphomicrobiales bacterium]
MRIEAPEHTDLEPPVTTTLNAIFVSLELSRSKWLVTSLLPGGNERMSKHILLAGQIGELAVFFERLRKKVKTTIVSPMPIVVIHEAGLDGFWVHRTLVSLGVESHVVDAASVAVSRRRRRAKTDRLDGEALLRTLLAYKRGEPRVCSMVIPPCVDEEDRRRVSRERRSLIEERVKLVNRVKGLLFAQGIADFEPLKRNRRKVFETLRTGDGRELPHHLKATVTRSLDRLELLIQHIKDVEEVREKLVATADVAPDQLPAERQKGCALLMQLKGVGPDFAEVLWSEGLFRHFDNRRQLASYAGLTPTPWQSGSISREQGVSKSGNPTLRTMMVQLSWFWLLHQPGSALSLWFRKRTSAEGGTRRKPAIIALARKLLIALWKFVNHGVVIEGAIMKQA